MSAVSNSVMPRSIALWITLREVSRSVRWPKLLQPRPTAETRRPEPPRLRICMDGSHTKADQDRIVACTLWGCKSAILKGFRSMMVGQPQQQKDAAPVRRGD